MTGALDGVRVLDLTQVILGPAATQVLADFGAEVLKIERPGGGDLARAFAPFLGGESTKYLSVNRNKKSLALDLKSPAGRSAFLALVPTADVVVSNFRPGVMEGLGLGYEHLRPLHPGLIYAEGTGWGVAGPLVEGRKPGHELLGQALAGLAAKNAGGQGLPRALPAPVADFSASQLLVQGILLALLARARSGRGQRVSVSLLDGLLALQQWDEVGRLNLGPGDGGVPDHEHPLQGIYRTADGCLALVGWFRPDPLANVCRALGLSDYSQEERFCTLERLAQPEHAGALRALLAARLLQKPTSEWLAILEAHDVLCGEVLPPGAAYEHPQATANGAVRTVQHPTLGALRLVGPPVRLGETPGTVRTAPPLLGEHTDEVLRALRPESP
ncbi:MAG TPA: CoA transferase [Chloroflexota bacterium]|nr:CoA transferase [Chloroflexota bacterium]